MRESVKKLVDVLNGFCPTGEGGGKSNSCGSKTGSGKVRKPTSKPKGKRVKEKKLSDEEYEAIESEAYHKALGGPNY